MSMLRNMDCVNKGSMTLFIVLGSMFFGVHPGGGFDHWSSSLIRQYVSWP